jgi:hypothetical protein
MSVGDIKHWLGTGLCIQSRSALHLNIPNIIGQLKKDISFQTVFLHMVPIKLWLGPCWVTLQANIWLITVASPGCVGPGSPWKSPSFMYYYITSVCAVQCYIFHNSYQALVSKTCRSQIKKTEVKYCNKIISVRSKSSKIID